MIVTKILGGLGNQLFQYAAGKALAVQNNAELKLDLTGFKDYQLRDFELNHFNVVYNIATGEEIKDYKASTSFQRMKARLSPASHKRFYKEPFFHFDPAFFSLRSPVYVQGYFQSEKYFAAVKEIIRQEFVFKDSFSAEIKAFAQKISQENSVAVHVRRGDYKNAESLRVHGVLPQQYYQQAIAYVKKHLREEPQFYFFSDDPSAAKELTVEGSEIVSGRVAKNHYEDFYLMSQCRHNIIANSSFSWWAAWLNNHADKLVVAPKRWFNEGPKDTQDLLPDTWIRL
ncbi:alpha-1,2-fucosyltransferase [Flavisolibacter ginsenosidimutans]|uniref:Alpha-1,2-fucosyltransferase n=1 Tax=Flavisolibacter ginsenosidimutans TaxID=661481 RepID=A0A5B8UDK1_9BACT|nr:alpha-1,2-fucosyltransferase [Flavisolibacter ginsenosidimutans]QEC54757.1 alpha-1,2-fucosyltransferase [Flavisolibacter ginsenosidimutans]